MAQTIDAGRSKRNGQARMALKSSATDVLEDFVELRKDISKLAEAAGKSAQSEVKHVGARLEDVGAKLRSRADQSLNYATDRVRSHPAAAVGISLGIGLLLGMALSPRH